VCVRARARAWAWGPICQENSYFT
jgi:hypothetical protein